MYEDTVFVGLDYHQKAVQVCVLDRAGRSLANRAVANDCGELARCVARHGRRVQAAIESCTGAADLAEQLVRRAGWSVDLAHPGFVKRMKQNPDKSDFSDARMLADLERVGYLPRVWLAPEPIRELRRLVRFRQQWVDQQRQCKQRILALLRDHRIRYSGRRWTRAFAQWLQQLLATEQLGTHSVWILGEHRQDLQAAQVRIKEVEQRLQEVTRGDRIVQTLLKYPGVGPVTAWLLRAEIGCFDRFRSGKQLSRYCGLSPRNASSGERQADAGLIKAGNRLLRATLIQVAHGLMRRDPRWVALAQRGLGAGKPKNVVVAAVCNRWLRGLYHEMRTVSPAA